jgi:prepilin peptidase CpaA
MIGLLVFLFGVFTTLGMCVLAAKSDYKGFKIPNTISVVIVACFVVTYGLLTVLEQRDVFFKPIGAHIGAALLVLMVTGAMFALKKLGAGDSKMATAISLWVGFGGLAPFLFYMSLAGGVIAATSLYLQKKKPFASPAEGSWIDVAQKGGGTVPYGIAIAVGALASFIYLGFFSFAKWQAMF